MNQVLPDHLPLDLAGAASDVGQAAAGPSAGPATSSHGWHSGSALRGEFGRGFAGRARRLTWTAELPDEQKRAAAGGEWEYRDDAVLWTGQTVAEFVQSPAFRCIPDEIKSAGRSTRQRDWARRELADWDHKFRLAHPNLAPTRPAYFAAFARVYETLAHARGLSCKRSAMLQVRKRIARGEPTDGRLRGGRLPLAADARLVERVRAVYLHANRFSQVAALQEQVRLAGELGIPPLSRWQVRTCIASLPAAAKAAGREKERIFEGAYVPKVRIDYTAVAAGDWLVLDGRIADVQVRIADACGGWKAMRPVVLGVLDARSTKLTVEVRRTENYDGILAGLKRHVAADGMPLHLTRDQGEAYKKAGGPRHFWQHAKIDAERIGDVFRRFGCTVHGSIPYRAWAKKIESIWRLIKAECDRWFASFWGGCPAERSDAAEELVAHHVEELPTFAEFVEYLQTAVETYNARPRRALGGLSPNLMFDKFRGEVRRIDPDVLDVYFTVAEGPRRVGRDGVRYHNLLYTIEPEDLVKLQGRDVWILPSLDSVGQIALCDKHEKLLCYAIERRLLAAGAKDEHFRAAMQKAARVRRLAKAYLPERDFLLETTTGQVLRARREQAQAQEAALRKSLPEPATPGVTIVRPDLVEGAQKIKRRAARTVASACSPDARQGGPVNGFERLAQCQEGGGRPARVACGWAEYPAEHAQPDAPAQEADGDVYRRLAEVV